MRQKRLSKCFKGYAIHLNRFHRLFLLFIIICGLWSVVCGLVIAEDKTWSGSGDASSWSDGNNWYPATEPTLSDDVTIDATNASVSCDETFRAKSITIGGRETSTLTSENFIYGTVSPASTSDIAILNRSGGTITLKGVGVLTLSGQYKDSEGTLAAEPNFIFWVE